VTPVAEPPREALAQSFEEHGLPCLRLMVDGCGQKSARFSVHSNGDVVQFKHNVPLQDHINAADVTTSSAMIPLKHLLDALGAPSEAQRLADIAFAAKAKAEVETDMLRIVQRMNKAEASAKDFAQMAATADNRVRQLEEENAKLKRDLVAKLTVVGFGAHSNDQGEPETILEEAARLTSTDRQASYGHPLDNHGKTAALWTAYLGKKLRSPLDAREVCWLNVLQKGSRDSYSEKRDNLTDGAGYLRNAEMITERLASYEEEGIDE